MIQVIISKSLRLITPPPLSLAFLLVTLEDLLPDYIGFSGLVAVMTAGIALRQREPDRAVRISAKYSKLWKIGRASCRERV